MAAAKKKTTKISGAKSFEELSEFWDSHSLGDYWGQTREASFDVRFGRRRRVTIDPQLYAQVEALAHRRGISPETLVNLWLTGQVGKQERSRTPKLRGHRRKEQRAPVS